MIELKLPELGENIVTAEVSRLLVREGDAIQAGQNVMELESEKASFPLPCPSPGRVAKIRVKEGATVSVGETVLEIEESSAADKPAKKEEGAPKKDEAAKKESAAPKKEEPAKPRAVEPPKESAAKKTEEPPKEEKPAAAGKERVEGPTSPAGPATRKLARELGVDLREVDGSERGGRITRDDVKTFVKQHISSDAPSGDVAVQPLPDFSAFGPVKREALNAIGRTSARRLSLAWRTIPHVTQHDSVDITDMDAARERFNEKRQGKGAKITVTAIAIQAVVVALKAFPHFNSSLDPASMELLVKDYYHIGLAVDTERGLLVPVVRDADKKSLLELAAEIAELAEKARESSLTRQDMEGGTFTITNLGGIGGSFFTPIINYPEVAILGMGRAQRTDRLRLPLSLSYDHRVVNGADGARFIVKIGELLASPFQLLAEM